MAGSVFQRLTQISVAEGNTTIQVEFVRSGSTAGAVTIQYGIDSDTATAGLDYSASGGIVVMPDGAASVLVPIAILDDDLAEPTEVVAVSLISADGAELLAPRTLRVSILDDEDPAPPPPEDPPLVSAYAIGTNTLIGGLDRPINFAFVPADEYLMYIAEKDGVIRVADLAAGTVDVLLDLRSLVNNAGDRGLMDVAVHPDFANNPYVYAFYMADPPESAASYGAAGADGNGNRYSHLVRFTADADTGYRSIIPDSGVILLGGAGQSLSDISGNGDEDFTDPSNAALPASDRVFDADDRVINDFKQDYLKVDSLSHAGGRLLFGPDGALYVFTGDGTSYDYPDPRAADVQSLDGLSGKVLRIDPLTGQGYADNPFTDQAEDLDANRAKIFQYGLRNPFSAAFDGDGNLYIADVGWFSYEEINTAGPGANFGWPYYEGGDGGTLLQTPQHRDRADAIAFYAGVEAGTTVITPAFRAFSHDSSVAAGYHMQAIISGAMIGAPGAYPASLAGRYMVSDFVGGAVYSIDPTNPDDINYLMDWPGDFGPIAMAQHGDGDIYYVDMGAGTIGRLEIADLPAESPAILSVAAETPTLAEGNAGPTPFTFRVTRTGDLGLAFTVDWKVAGALGAGTIMAEADDFAGGSFPTGTISFAAEQTEATITIEVAADATAEFDERFALALDEPSFGATIAEITAQAVITNDDGGPAILAIASAVEPEGTDALFTEFAFTVTRTGNLFGASSATWSAAPATGPGTMPASAEDFAGAAFPAGTVTFLAGQALATVSLLVQADIVAELNERFTVTLADASPGAEIATATAQGIILNDDTTVSLGAPVTRYVVEGNAGPTLVSLTVLRSGVLDGTTEVEWTLTPGGRDGTLAVDEADFFDGEVPTAGTITFAEGETEQAIEFLIAGDLIPELNESFTLSITPQPGTAAGVAAVPVAILDDDVIRGTAGDDILLGSDRGDLFLLGQGHDTITAGAGGDTFRFTATAIGPAAETSFTLTDFHRAENERLDLSWIDANALTEANDAFAFIGTAAFSGTPGEVRWQQEVGFRLIQANVDADPAADLTIRVNGTGAVLDSWFRL